MSFQAKRELLAQTALRYRTATRSQKVHILHEFVAATGYARKYAIRLLTSPVIPPATPLKRPRAPHYGTQVREAIEVAWAAANFICAKRLVPFLPELIPTLERHGHLNLSDELRAQILAISPATVDRLLKHTREMSTTRGISTTKPGALLKRQVPIRTFADWHEGTPGFMEADLVAHCGTANEGAFLYTLVLTDVATGWTECLALLHRSQHAVIGALDQVRRLLPFPLRGLDTDNGSEFLNAELLAYCEREHITFTRGRAYRKNDQCFVEQKNGVIVRQLIGYDRFEGEAAYRQLAEVYRAVRLYVNFFQPSMKLVQKQRIGSAVCRTYDDAKTPLQRLLAMKLVEREDTTRLTAIYEALDPVRLLQQLAVLQDALWQHAVFRTPTSIPPASSGDEVSFNPGACGLHPESISSAPSTTPPDPATRATRTYRRSAKSKGPRTYRTRPDPFAAVLVDIQELLEAHPEWTAKVMLAELQQHYPGQYPDKLLRTLQRRVQSWRAQAIVTFDAQWMEDEVLAGQVLPASLQARMGDNAPLPVDQTQREGEGSSKNRIA